MNSINWRLCRIKRTQKTNKPRRCLRSRYCWNDREGAGNLGNYYHRENSLRYGIVCLMARCCCWWELLLWSKDEEIFTSRSKIHWHWRDQGTGKMVLNALPTRHKESLRWCQKLEKSKVYMSLIKGEPKGETVTRGICKLSVSFLTGEYFRNGIKEAVGSEKWEIPCRMRSADSSRGTWDKWCLLMRSRSWLGSGVEGMLWEEAGVQETSGKDRKEDLGYR